MINFEIVDEVSESVLQEIKNLIGANTMDNWNVTTSALYNGRERGVLLTAYRSYNNYYNFNKPTSAYLHIFFSECRNSDAIVTVNWKSYGAKINPPTEIPLQGRNEETFGPDCEKETAKYILNTIKYFYNSK